MCVQVYIQNKKHIAQWFSNSEPRFKSVHKSRNGSSNGIQKVPLLISLPSGSPLPIIYYPDFISFFYNWGGIHITYYLAIKSFNIYT